MKYLSFFVVTLVLGTAACGSKGSSGTGGAGGTGGTGGTATTSGTGGTATTSGTGTSTDDVCKQAADKLESCGVGAQSSTSSGMTMCDPMYKCAFTCYLDASCADLKELINNPTPDNPVAKCVAACSSSTTSGTGGSCVNPGAACDPAGTACCGEAGCSSVMGTTICCLPNTKACSDTEPCCDGLVCAGGSCTICAAKGEGCSDTTPCCSGLTCNGGMCE